MQLNVVPGQSGSQMIRTPVLAFCVVDGASQLFSICFDNKGRSSSGVRKWVPPYRTRISTKMLAQRTRNPTEKEWLAQKPRLKQLWLEEGKTTAAVKNIMETEYNFHATYAT